MLPEQCHLRGPARYKDPLLADSSHHASNCISNILPPFRYQMLLSSESWVLNKRCVSVCIYLWVYILVENVQGDTPAPSLTMKGEYI